MNTVWEILNRNCGECYQAGAHVQLDKWIAECEYFKQEAYQNALKSLGVNEPSMEPLGIYVFQKIRRLIGTYLGAGKPDPYTLKIMSAMNDEGFISNQMMLDTLMSRYSYGTASTQAASTRKALVALDMAQKHQIEGKQGLLLLRNNPIVQMLHKTGE